MTMIEEKKAPAFNPIDISPNEPAAHKPSSTMVARLLRWLIEKNPTDFNATFLLQRADEHHAANVHGCLADLRERGLIYLKRRGINEFGNGGFGGAVYGLKASVVDKASDISAQLWLDALTDAISREPISNSDGPSPDDS